MQPIGSMVVRRLASVSSALAWAVLLTMIAIATAPLMERWSSWGGHDWDQMASHRLLIVKSIREYGQFPFWNPYGCGGHPAWGGVESGTVLVSPWLPFYLSLPIPVALRLEVVGTALISAVGTWLWASRFTTSPALRLFACAVFVVNGRWALQAAAGHTWHLYYAWLPWALYFFDRACRDEVLALRDIVPGAAVLALMVYTGAIYPLPHAAVCLAVYGIALAIRRRELRPIAAGTLMAVLAFGLAAPKLLPILETLGRFPRLVASTEVIDLRVLVSALTSPTQTVPVPQWGWHEYGIYIGWAGLLGASCGVIGARGQREHGLKWLFALLVLLGFGSFHAYAPWTLFHEYLPIFKSQHVPSRWQYPALLIAAALTAAFGERRLARAGRRPVLELALLVLVAATALDIGSKARHVLKGSFWMELRPTARLGQPFHQYARAPAELRYRRNDYAPPATPAMLANVGVLECATFPGLNVWAKNADGVIAGLGAKGRGDRAYRGEVFLGSGSGSARITAWSPNAVDVRVEGGAPGDLLILNQNYDPGWSAGGRPAESYDDVVATRIPRGDGVITFRYRPRSWWLALACFAVTLAAITAVWRRRRSLGG